MPDDLQAFESLDIQGSDTLVSDLHKWLFDKVADKPIGKVCLDGFCLDIYGAVQEAVDQFKKEAAGATAFIYQIPPRKDRLLSHGYSPLWHGQHAEMPISYFPEPWHS